MQFRPLITEDQLRKAAADIEAAAKADAETRKPVPIVAQVPVSGNDVVPDARIEVTPVPFFARAKAAIGFGGVRRRIETCNKIGRTLSMGIASGLYDRNREGGGREYAMAVRLYAMARDPMTPDGEVPVILGWMQALVAMSCPGMTPARVRSA